jgi:hypothetical protein
MSRQLLNTRQQSSLPSNQQLLLLLTVFSAQCWIANASAGADLVFDGTDDFATVFPSFDLFSEWTIEAWVRPSAPIKAATCILGLQTVSARNLFTVTTTADAAWSVLYGEDQEIPTKGWSGSGYQPGSYTAYSHHFAVTQDAPVGGKARLKFLLNGTLQAQWTVLVSSLQVRPEPTLPMLLGACHAAGTGRGEGAGRGVFRSRFFKGRMDEVRLWSRERTEAEIAETWQWTGDALNWPAPSSTTVAERASHLGAQYSCDLTSAKLYDSSGNSQHGQLGIPGDAMNAPRYDSSIFRQELSYGPLYLQLRKGVSQVVDLTSEDAYVGQLFQYNALLIVKAPSHPSAALRLPTGPSWEKLETGALVPSLSLMLKTNETVVNDTFAIIPCKGFPEQPPILARCTDAVLNRTYSSTASVIPFAGPAFALQLFRYGGFVRLPPVPATTSFEFWAQFNPPIVRRSVILSITEQRHLQGMPERDIVNWWLDPLSTEAVLDVCVTSGTGTGSVRFKVPGVATPEPQHLAISFELLDANYNVTIFRNSQVLLSVVISNPCTHLDSPHLRPPVLGRGYLRDEPGAVGGSEPRGRDHLAMSIAEIRLWNYFRSGSELSASMTQRLQGTEAGLIAYFPINSEDATQLATFSPRQLVLSNEKQSALSSSRRISSSLAMAKSATIECEESFAVCPDAIQSVGFALRPSPFDMPPEIVALETTALEVMSIPLVAYDLDNYNGLGTQTVDTLSYEILQVPDPKCGHIYPADDSFRILEEQKRLEYGLPPTTTITNSGLPLRFVPFEGATIAEEEAMGGTCTTDLQYRVLDPQGLASPAATVNLKVLHPGPTLLSVHASDPKRAGSAGMLRLTFDASTNEPDVKVEDLLTVVNGSFGSLKPSLSWIINSTTLLLDLKGSSHGAELIENVTLFRVQRDAGLKKKDDPWSMPYHGISPPLEGDLVTATCNPGSVLNWETGACDECPMGTFWTLGEQGAHCALCEGGMFSNQSALLSCDECAPGRYLLPLTPDSIASSRTMCIYAKAGMYSSRNKATAVEDCQVGTFTDSTGMSECSPCPQFADCEVSSPPRSEAFAISGYFRMENGSFHECRVPSSCSGRSQCVEGTQDPLKGCYPCAQGWTRFAGAVRDRRECVKCPSFFEGFVLCCVVFGCTAMFAIVLTRINITGARHMACLHPFMVKIMLSHLQLMSAFGRFEEWELRIAFDEAAPALRKLFAWIFFWDGAMPAYLLPFECMIDEFEFDRNTRLWLTLAFWALLPISFLFCCLVLGLILKESSETLSACSCLFPKSKDFMPEHKLADAGGITEARSFGIWRNHSGQKRCKEQLGDFINDSMGLLIAALVMVYPTTLQQMMSFIRCDTLDGNFQDSHLLAEPALTCGEGDHVQLAAAACGILLFWGLGFPCLCGVLLYQNRKRVNEFQTRVRLGLLGAEYEPAYYFWDVFILLRRFACTAAMLSAPAARRSMQFSVLLALGIISLFIHSFYQPFDNRAGLLLDVLESQALKLFCAACCAFLLGFSDVTHWAFCSSIIVIILIIHVSFVVRLILTCAIQVQRSIADRLIDEQMLGRGPSLDPGTRNGPIQSLWERILLIEVETQRHRAVVHFQPQPHDCDMNSETVQSSRTKWMNENHKGIIEVAAGPAGDDVQKFERIYVAQGLAQCVGFAITSCKLERVSVTFLEYASRLAFARKMQRLQCLRNVQWRLEQKYHPKNQKMVEGLEGDIVQATLRDGDGRTVVYDGQSLVLEDDHDGYSGCSRFSILEDGKYFRLPDLPRYEDTQFYEEGTFLKTNGQFLTLNGKDGCLEPTESKKAALMVERHHHGLHLNKEARMSWHNSVQNPNEAADLFDDETFRIGMLAGDFQTELIAISFFPREQLDACFKNFMIGKGIEGDPTMNSRDKYLGSIVGHDKEVGKIKSRGSTAMTKEERISGKKESPFKRMSRSRSGVLRSSTRDIDDTGSTGRRSASKGSGITPVWPGSMKQSDSIAEADEPDSPLPSTDLSDGTGPRTQEVKLAIEAPALPPPDEDLRVSEDFVAADTISPRSDEAVPDNSRPRPFEENVQDSLPGAVEEPASATFFGTEVSGARDSTEPEPVKDFTFSQFIGDLSRDDSAGVSGVSKVPDSTQPEPVKEQLLSDLIFGQSIGELPPDGEKLKDTLEAPKVEAPVDKVEDKVWEDALAAAGEPQGVTDGEPKKSVEEHLEEMYREVGALGMEAPDVEAGGPAVVPRAVESVVPATAPEPEPVPASTGKASRPELEATDAPQRSYSTASATQGSGSPSKSTKGKKANKTAAA